MDWSGAGFWAVPAPVAAVSEAGAWLTPCWQAPDNPPICIAWGREAIRGGARAGLEGSCGGEAWPTVVGGASDPAPS